jgi:hypothetical protein
MRIVGAAAPKAEPALHRWPASNRVGVHAVRYGDNRREPRPCNQTRHMEEDKLRTKDPGATQLDQVAVSAKAAE